MLRIKIFYGPGTQPWSMRTPIWTLLTDSICSNKLWIPTTQPSNWFWIQPSSFIRSFNLCLPIIHTYWIYSCKAVGSLFFSPPFLQHASLGVLADVPVFTVNLNERTRSPPPRGFYSYPWLGTLVSSAFSQAGGFRLIALMSSAHKRHVPHSCRWNLRTLPPPLFFSELFFTCGHARCFQHFPPLNTASCYKVIISGKQKKNLL